MINSRGQLIAGKQRRGPKPHVVGPRREEWVVMTGMESSEADSKDASKDQRIRFWMTLIVTTVIAALTAYVLSFALLGPSQNASPHRSVVSILRAHS
jgi:hypothetical protein